MKTSSNLVPSPPQPYVATDYEISRPQFQDLSLHSSLESPAAATSDDFPVPGGLSGHDSQGLSSFPTGSLNPLSCPPSDLMPQNREQAFRTEFNLIYTCSPLNANLGTPVATEQRLSQLEGGFSPADSFHSTMSSQGLLGDAGLGPMSPYGEPQYGGGYRDSATPPPTSNPPQKKKASSPHINYQNALINLVFIYICWFFFFFPPNFSFCLFLWSTNYSRVWNVPTE